MDSLSIKDIINNYIREYCISYNHQDTASDLSFNDRILLVLKGCALGDYAGQPFEGNFSDFYISKETLYETSYGCTDDTILTCATAHTLNKFEKKNASYEEEVESYANAYRAYAKKYPMALGGYGGRFLSWVYGKKESDSCGNGSAMRVSPCGCFLNPQTVIKEAYLSAVCTHNHPEGIKGAIVTAMCIWMAFCGYSKKEIGNYVSKYYKDSPYSPAISFKKMEQYKHFQGNPAICQNTVPLAVSCFINSENFEDCIAKAISFGFDTDTQAAIAGSIAAAYYQKFDEKSENIWEKIVDESPYVKEEITNYEAF